MQRLLEDLFSSGIIYLIFYLVLFISIIIETIKEFSKYRLILVVFFFITLSLFTGLRWETGTDWFSYKELFDTLELDWTFLLNVYSFDLGYVVLNAFVKLFTDNYTLFLLIDSFIAVGIVYYFLKKYSLNPIISLFVFYNAFFVAQFMGSNRRIIALGSGLFIFYFIFQKNIKKYTLWQIIAFLFHRSSIILILTWFVPRKRFNTKQILILLFICLIIGIPQLPFKLVGHLGEAMSGLTSNSIVDKMVTYSDNNFIPDNTNPVILMILSVMKRSIFISFYLYVININKGVLDSITDYFFNIYIVGFAIYLLFNGSPMFQLLSTYFTFIEIALIGRIWNYTNIRTKFIFLGVLFFYGFFQLLSSLNAYPELYIPYKLFNNQ
jgi:hypothetical protein